MGKQKNRKWSLGVLSSLSVVVLYLFAVALLSPLLISCEGPAGSAGEQGEQGEPGEQGDKGVSCEVVDNGDGTKTITCEDGTTATVSDGTPGDSCTIVDNGDGTKTITCEDGTEVTVSDGDPGVSTGSITVTAVDTDDVLLEGVKISTDPASSSANTDASGIAMLENVPVGIYDVRASKSGYKSFVETAVSVTAGAALDIEAILGPGVHWNLIEVVGVSGARGDTDESAEARVTLTGGPDNTIITSGLRNVGVGNYVYLAGAAADEAEEAITAWAWEVSPPAGSSVAFEFTDTGDATGTPARVWAALPESRWARFRPDVPGIYTVKLTATTAVGTEESSIEIYAGTYLGEQSCAACHSNPGIVGEHKAVYNGYKLTGHATKFQGTYSSYSGSSDYCLPCHTTAYDESAANGGFDDQLQLAGWDPATDGSVGAFLESFYATLQDFLSDPATLPAQRLMNVQCESCHGPGSNHPPAEAHLSFSGGVCKQCHPQPNEWALSKHSLKPTEHVASGGSCAPCHTGQGFVVVMDHGEEAVYPNDATVDVSANMFEPGNAQPIGCPTCHDPHKFTHPYAGFGGDKSDQLRFEGEVEAPMGFTVDAEKSAVCVKCHSNKRDADYFAAYVAGGKSRGPHHNGQADILEGQGGYEYPGEAYTATAFHSSLVAEKCAGCHMHPGAGNACADDSDCEIWAECSRGSCISIKMGVHTFNMTWTDPSDNTTYEHVESCNTAGCHSAAPLVDFDRVPLGVTGDGWDCDGATTGIQSEIQNLIDKLEACLISNNAYLDDNGELKSSGYNNEAVSDQERFAIWNLILVDGDGSLGVHNAHYAAQLLRDSYADLGCAPALACARP